MEELRSTELLDREILEDARKKAHRILKTADETIGASTARWDKKIAGAVAAITEKYAQRQERTREEIMARLPLDKRRARFEYIEGLLQRAMENCLAALPRAKALAILEGELSRLLETYRSSVDETPEPWRICCRGLGGAELEGLLAKLRISEMALQPQSPAPRPGPEGEFPSLVIDTGQARINASLSGAAEALLAERRAELVEALLGKGAADHAGEAGHD